YWPAPPAAGAAVVVGAADVVDRGTVVLDAPGVLDDVDAPPGVVVVDARGRVLDEPRVSGLPETVPFLPTSAGGNLHAESPAIALIMKSRQILAGNVPPATDWPL